MPIAADALLSPVRALVDAGRLEEAIAATTAALADDALTPEARMSLLELRCECHDMRLQIGAALADAEAMAALARRHKAPALQAIAALSAATVNHRIGKVAEAAAAGRAALKAARRCGSLLLEARALERLSNVGHHTGHHTGDEAAKALASARQALALFESLGDLRGQARAWLRQFSCLHLDGRTAEVDQAAARALALARQCGALREEAHALNCLTFHVADLALRLKRLTQALVSFESAELSDGAAASVPYLSYLAGHLAQLEGRPAQAARQLARAVRQARADDTSGRITFLAELGRAQLEAGHPAAALAATRRASKLHRAIGLAAQQDGSRSEFWWRHSQALSACGFEHGAPQLAPHGSITLVSGIAAYRPRPKGVAVAAINAALEGIVRAMAVELAPRRVNAVSPGWVRTPIWDDVAGAQSDRLLATMAEQLPVGRIGTPDDIADAIVFLLGNGYATGSVLHVDGGHRLV